MKSGMRIVLAVALTGTATGQLLSPTPLTPTPPHTKTPVMDSKQAASALNAQFLSERGLVMRSLREWKIWCGKTADCYEGTGSCMMSSVAWNFNNSVNNKSEFVGQLSQFGNGLIAFNTTTVETTLARCYWPTDGMTNVRYGSGCGCGAPFGTMNCKSPFSPYKNMAPNGRLAFGDNPYVSNCTGHGHFKEEAARWYKGQGPCFEQVFYRGPAFEESQGHYFGGSELLQMYKLEKLVQGGAGNRNEVMLDSGRVDMMMSKDPGATIMAIVLSDYWREHKGYSQTALEMALELRSTLKAKYNVELPIVRQSFGAKVSREQGPFSEYVHPNRDPSDASTEAVVV